MYTVNVKIPKKSEKSKKVKHKFFKIIENNYLKSRHFAQLVSFIFFLKRRRIFIYIGFKLDLIKTAC